MRVSPTILADCDSIIVDIAPSLRRLSGSRILITGASGFLMSYVVDVIARWNETANDAACQILALDNFRTGSPDRLAHLDGREDVTFIEHDVVEPLELAGPVDWIVHGASVASPSKYRRYPLETLDANITGTRRMLEVALEKDSEGVVVMSSSEIYGDPDSACIPTSEEYNGNVSCTGPRACYDESKRVAETLSSIYHRNFGVPVKIIRPFNVFGPGQRLDDKRIIPDLMSAIIHKQPITLYSDGTATRSFCYVSDAVRAITTILVADHTQGLAFNVGSDEAEISIRDLAEVVCKISRDLMQIEWATVRYAESDDADYTTDNPRRRCPDLTRVRQAIGYAPKVDLRDGLARTLRSYLESCG